MKYFYIEPEVAGELGANTVIDTAHHPPIVRILDYEFKGWLGDVILESFPCFIVTNDAANNLKNAKVSGAEFCHMQISISPEFREMHPDLILPKFQWVKVTGLAAKDDFGIARDKRLVVSQKVLLLLQSLSLKYAEIEDFKDGDLNT